jgi:hypothetical protein
VELLRPISEDEMIAVFLQAEIESHRFGEAIRSLLARDSLTPQLVQRPNLADPAENAARRRLLDEHRAYERREGLFGGFPHDVAWHRALLAPDEVLDILFIDWDWWLALSGGSRRPRDAAARIRGGRIRGQTRDEDEPIAAALRRAPPPPELIALTTPDLRPLVLVEGHVRLTAYALFPHYLPERLEILLGISPHATDWSNFG